MSARHRVDDASISNKTVMCSQLSVPIAKVVSFEIGQSAIGFWVVESKDHHLGGIFRSQRDAIHFVQHECPDELFDLVYLPEGKELLLTRDKS